MQPPQVRPASSPCHRRRAASRSDSLLLVAGAHTVNATLYDKLSFNFIRDIAPIAGISREPAVMTVNPSVPAKTVPEFIAYAKANPGKINMAPALGRPAMSLASCSR
jgi:tripartite-type tricarboxylate transporter receptor subunit TctC